MRKFISIVMAVAMLTGVLCISSNASGALLFRDDFNAGILPNNWLRGDFNAFFAAEDSNGNGVCAGYHNAVVLQGNFQLATDPKAWDQFYASVDVNVRDLDGTDDSVRNGGVSMWYRERFDDEGAQGPAYSFGIDVTTGTAWLNKDASDFVYTDEDGQIKTGKTPALELARVETGRQFRFGEWEEEEWFNIGMRVTAGKIECFLDQECIMSAEYDPNGEKVGPYSVDCVNETVGTGKSPILLWNDSLYVFFDNFEVWEPGYADDFKGFVFGDANNDGLVTVEDVVVMLRYIAGWENGEAEDAENDELDEDFVFDFDCSDVDLDGEVTLRDAVLIMQHLAGWRVTLGQEQ